MDEIPEVDKIFGTNDHKQIVSFLTGKDFSKDDPLFFRSLMTPKHYAYIKNSIKDAIMDVLFVVFQS